MLAFGNSRPETVAEPTATDAPTISAADDNAAGNAFVRALAIERGIRRDEAATDKVLSFNFEEGGDILLHGTPENKERFMQVLRRSMMLDPQLEEMIHEAQAAGVQMNIDLVDGDPNTLGGGAGSRTRTDPVDQFGNPPPPDALLPTEGGTVRPLDQRVDLADMSAHPPAMRTGAAGNQQTQEILVAHEMRELIFSSLVTDMSKLDTPSGRVLFNAAHRSARQAEASMRLLTHGRRVNRVGGANYFNGAREDSPEGTVRRIQMRFSDGSRIEFDMDADSKVIGVAETREPQTRRVPTRQGSN